MKVNEVDCVKNSTEQNLDVPLYTGAEDDRNTELSNCLNENFIKTKPAAQIWISFFKGLTVVNIKEIISIAFLTTSHNP